MSDHQELLASLVKRSSRSQKLWRPCANRDRRTQLIEWRDRAFTQTTRGAAAVNGLGLIQMEQVLPLLDHAHWSAVIIAGGFAAPKVARAFAIVWGAIFGGNPKDFAERIERISTTIDADNGENGDAND